MNTSLRKNAKHRFIRSALAKKYDRAALADILRRAESHYAALAAQCADAAPGEQFHLDNTILPTAAIYKALLETDSEHALAVTHEALIGLCQTGNRAMQIILRIPGMKGLFMGMLPKMALKMFGRDSGFDYTNFSADKTHLAMDTTVCCSPTRSRILKVNRRLSNVCP